MFYVYILQSEKDQRTYVGYTNNLKQRLREHNKGSVRTTRNRRPLRLIFSENYNSKEQAEKREVYWKSGAGRRKLKKFWDGGFPPIQISFE